MSIGQTIKIYRKEKNLTQSQLAELIGVSTQAISKWETDVGMPDISQVVPLARVLEISTDKLLGHTDVALSKEAEEIRYLAGGINLISCLDRAKSLYERSSIFFNKQPDVPDIALVCLECFTELFANGALSIDKTDFLAEAERYQGSIFRYEKNADNICKTYYLMSRAYDLCGENDKAEDMLKKLPYIFGDREYWEAEIAYADKKYDVALEKIKKSFAVKARFVARCIRLAARIKTAQGGDSAAQDKLQLNEYMLRIIDAFLSGGDYMPYRQITQKASLLSGLVGENIAVGNIETAKERMQNLLDMREEFFEFLDNPDDKHCLMFVEGDTDGRWGDMKEFVNERVKWAQASLDKV